MSGDRAHEGKGIDRGMQRLLFDVPVNGGKRKIGFQDAEHPLVRGMDMAGGARAGRFVVDRVDERQQVVSLVALIASSIDSL